MTETKEIIQARTNQTGGWVYVDTLTLKDNTYIGVTDESIALYAGPNDEMDEEFLTGESCLGSALIYEHGREIEQYGRPDPLYFINKVEDDHIIMKNGIIIVVGPAEIVIYENFTYGTHIATIMRPAISPPVIHKKKLNERERRHLERVYFHLSQIKSHMDTLGIEWLNEPDDVDLNEYLEEDYPFAESFNELVPKIKKWVDNSQARIRKNTIR